MFGLSNYGRATCRHFYVWPDGGGSALLENDTLSEKKTD